MSADSDKGDQVKAEMKRYFVDLFGETGLQAIGKSPDELVTMLDTMTREEVLSLARAPVRKDGPKLE